MVEKHEIHPYLGVNDISFGMTRADVSRRLGAPTSTRKSRSTAEITDRWRDNTVQLTFESLDGPLVEIGLYPGVGDVVIRDLSLFSLSAEKALSALVEMDGDPMLYLGVIVFFNLGLSATGFIEDDAGQKSVTAFVRGRWDDMRAKLEPFIA
jgi:hypothetical protein